MAVDSIHWHWYLLSTVGNLDSSSLRTNRPVEVEGSYSINTGRLSELNTKQHNVNVNGSRLYALLLQYCSMYCSISVREVRVRASEAETKQGPGIWNLPHPVYVSVSTSTRPCMYVQRSSTQSTG